MKMERGILLIMSWILFSVSICSSEEETPPPQHENFPRFFGIFSRPGDKNTPKQEGSSIGEHLGNVFKGGSIGFQVEARPLGPFHGFIDKAKEVSTGGIQGFIDKAKELIPIPLIPGLSQPPKGTDQKDLKPKPKPEEPWESEDDQPWETEVPYSDGPKLEGFDEHTGELDYTTEPIENIIQPRIRQRRSAESKVFHVPLQFLSNAKPFEVKIK